MESKKVIKEKRVLRSEEKDDIEKQASEFVGNQLVCGAWENMNQVAGEVWSSIHSSLISGWPIFAYKSTKTNSNLIQIVIVRNFKNTGNSPQPELGDTFSVGMMTTGFSSLMPNVSIDYLKTQVLQDLNFYKIDKYICSSLEVIISKLRKEIYDKKEVTSN